MKWTGLSSPNLHVPSDILVRNLEEASTVYQQVDSDVVDARDSVKIVTHRNLEDCPAKTEG